TDLDLDALGLDSGNYWCYAHQDIDAIYRSERGDWTSRQGPVEGFFVTATTLKDRSKLRNGHHTMEAFAFVGYEPFQRWAGTRFGARPPEYAQMKARLTERMIDAVATVVPGLKEH